jgi:hypothetical protein
MEGCSKAATKEAVAALEALLASSGLTPADVNGHIVSEFGTLWRNAKTYAKQGSGLPAERLEELQKGLNALQAEGVVERLKAAKQQREKDNEQLPEATKAAVAALAALLASSGLAPAGVNGYIVSEFGALWKNAKRYAEKGLGLPTEMLRGSKSCRKG